MLNTAKELLIAFGLLFGCLIVLTHGMEWLTENVSQTSIIIGFAMLVPLAFLQRFLQAGKLCFTAQEKKTIWGAISFILFFVFFAFAVMDIEGYGIGKIGLPSGFLGLLAMFLAMRNLESLKIPKNFENDAEFKQNTSQSSLPPTGNEAIIKPEPATDQTADSLDEKS